MNPLSGLEYKTWWIRLNDERLQSIAAFITYHPEHFALEILSEHCS